MRCPESFSFLWGGGGREGFTFFFGSRSVWGGEGIPSLSEKVTSFLGERGGRGGKGRDLCFLFFFFWGGKGGEGSSPELVSCASEVVSFGGRGGRGGKGRDSLFFFWGGYMGENNNI